MKNRLFIFSSVVVALILFFSGPAFCQEVSVYYARCNLKVLKGNSITWVNRQAAPTFIPAGTRLKVTRTGSTASLVDAATGVGYTLDIGADGDMFLEKFVTKNAVVIDGFPPDVQANIRNAVARMGMTKIQVYSAMGPPATVQRGKTNTMTYKDIMDDNLWVYARRRFGKNIGVAFDPSTGLVNRTEGIWK